MKHGDARELQRILAGAEAIDDEERVVRWLVQAIDALEADAGPGCLFLASAFTAWLTTGGDLTRDFLRLAPQRGRRSNARAIYQRVIANRNNPEVGADGGSTSTLRPSSTGRRKS